MTALVDALQPTPTDPAAGSVQIFVDWGSTNRRVYKVSDRNAHLLFADEMGVLSAPHEEWHRELDAIRLAALPDSPCSVLMAGMIGSNRGWVETPYVETPAGISDLAAAAVRIGQSDVRIIPGLCHTEEGRCDVMRGEETQVLGAVSLGIVPPNALICQPGTHNKWIRAEEGKVRSFRTVMTGEAFSLLQKHSSLAEFLTEQVSVGEDFLRGVNEAREGHSWTDLAFDIRASSLLKRRITGGSSYLSGLLIGSDLRTGLAQDPHEPLFILGQNSLTELYLAALREWDRHPTLIPSDVAFVHGMRLIGAACQ